VNVDKVIDRPGQFGCKQSLRISLAIERMQTLGGAGIKRSAERQINAVRLLPKVLTQLLLNELDPAENRLVKPFESEYETVEDIMFELIHANDSECQERKFESDSTVMMRRKKTKEFF